jgi:hypothetical protein
MKPHACLLALAFVASAHPQEILRTASGRPDLTGVWENNFGTPLERPASAKSLAVDQIEAVRLFDEGVKSRPDMSFNFGVQASQPLMQLRGEYRTSLVVEPANGRLPYTSFARERLSASMRSGFDGHDQRPLAERCMGSAGLAPMLPATENNQRRIMQTPDHVLIHSEQYGDARIVALSSAPRPRAVQSEMGESIARWDHDTLVVETSHLRADRPVRTVHAVAGSRLPVGPGSRIIERFTMMSKDEILYEFTIDDAGLYSAPWRAEYVMRRTSSALQEFACHEGNYSLVNVLQGARQAERRTTATQKQ